MENRPRSMPNGRTAAFARRPRPSLKRTQTCRSEPSVRKRPIPDSGAENRRPSQRTHSWAARFGTPFYNGQPHLPVSQSRFRFFQSKCVGVCKLEMTEPRSPIRRGNCCNKFVSCTLCEILMLTHTQSLRRAESPGENHSADIRRAVLKWVTKRRLGPREY